jgi:hypothetical protein
MSTPIQFLAILIILAIGFPVRPYHDLNPPFFPEYLLIDPNGLSLPVHLVRDLYEGLIENLEDVNNHHYRGKGPARRKANGTVVEEQAPS